MRFGDRIDSKVLQKTTKHLKSRAYVDGANEISIHEIDTTEHAADFLAYPLNQELLLRVIMGC